MYKYSIQEKYRFIFSTNLETSHVFPRTYVTVYAWKFIEQYYRRFIDNFCLFLVFISLNVVKSAVMAIELRENLLSTMHFVIFIEEINNLIVNSNYNSFGRNDEDRTAPAWTT